MFEGLKDMGKLLKQAKEMKSQMKKVQDELKRVMVDASSPDGKIKITMTGELEVTNVSIDPSVIDPSNQKALEKAIGRVFNEAALKSKNVATEKLSAVSGGLDIPGLNG